MNERIRQLAEQSYEATTVTTIDPVTQEVVVDFIDGSKPFFNQEKFAELIVRECVSVTDDLVNRNVDGSWTSNELYTDYNGALHEVKRRIQDHFGVAE